MFRTKKEVDSSSHSLIPTKIKNEPIDDQPKSTVVWRIRIKSAYELGSNLIFVDTASESEKSSKPTTYQPVLSDLITSEAESKLTQNTNVESKFNIHTISSLYKKIFTKDNKIIIRKVAEALQNLSESIKKKNDKLNEINCSRSTDAEKLMMRHQAHSEFNRVRDSNQNILKKQFEAVGHIFNHENFEILFQLFFLGILKMFIVSVSSSKGTLFKKIVSLLSQSLSSCNYQNERVLGLLKSKDFRADCIALVHFIEKYSETKFFDMLFISDADKKKILNPKDSEAESLSKPCLLSTNTKVPSIMMYSQGMNVLPVGSNLLLQSPNSSSTSMSQIDLLKADIDKKKSKIASALLKSVKGLKFSPLNPTAASKFNVLKKPFSNSSLGAVTSLALSAPNYKVSRITVASPSTGPISYSVSSSGGTTSFSAVNALSNSTAANSNSSSQLKDVLTDFSSRAQPMCTYSRYSSNIPSTSAFTNCSSIVPSSSSFMNSSSNTQCMNTFTNSSSSSTHTLPGSCNQSAPQMISSLGSSTIPISSSYPIVMHSGLPPVVPANYTPNVVLSASHASNRPRSVIVTPAIGVSNARALPPTYTATNVRAATQRIVQPASPLHQLLSPAIPNLLSQSADASNQGIRISSYPLAQIPPQEVPNLLPQPPANPSSDSAAHNYPRVSLSPIDVDSQSASTLRTYGSANEVKNRGPLPSLFNQNGMPSKFHPAVSADNSILSTSMASATVVSSPANVAFSHYRTISPAGNSENIQPNGPHSLLLHNPGDNGSKLIKDHNFTTCPTASPSDGLSLRTLLMDNGRSPLMNQNGPIEAPFPYSDKANFSLDLPPAMSSNPLTHDSVLATHHLPINNFASSSY